MAETGEKSGPEEGNAPAPGETSVAFQARCLLRAARAGTLATVTNGQPFASLVTPACAPDLSILVFLSSLSEHTRHLRAEPRCAIMVQGEPAGTNPQMTPRVTITGHAEPCDDKALKSRWLATHPYAAMYAEFTDFGLWRIAPESASLIGGFARAHRIGAAQLLPAPAAVRAIADAETSIIAHCNQDHAAAMDLLAKRSNTTNVGWQMIAADCDGCDLQREDIVLRCAWPAPVENAEDVRKALVNLVREMRARQG